MQQILPAKHLLKTYWLGNEVLWETCSRGNKVCLGKECSKGDGARSLSLQILLHLCLPSSQRDLERHRKGCQHALFSPFLPQLQAECPERMNLAHFCSFTRPPTPCQGPYL